MHILDWDEETETKKIQQLVVEKLTAHQSHIVVQLKDELTRVLK